METGSIIKMVQDDYTEIEQESDSSDDENEKIGFKCPFEEENMGVGKIACVIEDINKSNGTGRIKIGGVWKAKSDTDDIIRRGRWVRIVGIIGDVAYVRSVEAYIASPCCT